MTYLQKLKRDYPRMSEDKKWFGDVEDVVHNSCPSAWGYPDCGSDKCDPNDRCEECWNRVIPNSASWVRDKDGNIRCGNCKRWAITSYTVHSINPHEPTSHQVTTPYCPYCGALMDDEVISGGDAT